MVSLQSMISYSLVNEFFEALSCVTHIFGSTNKLNGCIQNSRKVEEINDIHNAQNC